MELLRHQHLDKCVVRYQHITDCILEAAHERGSMTADDLQAALSKYDAMYNLLFELIPFAVPCRAVPCRAVPCRAVPCHQGCDRNADSMTRNSIPF